MMKWKDKSTKSKKSKSANSKKSKSSKSNKSKNRKDGDKKKKKKKEKEKDSNLLPDISLWMNARLLYNNIKYLFIIMKQSRFPMKVRIMNRENADQTDSKQKNNQRKDLSAMGNDHSVYKDNEIQVSYKENIYPARNQALYFFVDSTIDSTVYIFVYLSGVTKLLKKLDALALEEHYQTEKFCTTRICPFHSSDMTNDQEMCYVMNVDVENFFEYKIIRYNWQDRVIGNTIIGDTIFDKGGRAKEINKGRIKWRGNIADSLDYILRISPFFMGIRSCSSDDKLSYYP